MICVSLGNYSFDECLEIMNNPVLADCLFELRTDLLGFSIDEYDRLCKSGKQILLTLKPEQTEDLLIETKWYGLLERVKFVDIPFDLHEKIILHFLELKNIYGFGLILSYHNFEKTPDLEFLKNIVQKCISCGADIVKIVCKANIADDCDIIRKLYSIFENLSQTIESKCRLNAFASGETGRITRFDSYRLGAPIAYCSAQVGRETAEGQPDVITFRNEFNI